MLVSSHAPWFVNSALGLTVIWLLLVAFFHSYLKLHHPSEFLALGEPGLQKRGSVFAIIGYVFSLRHRALNDVKFSLLCYAMAACFSATIILFIAASLGYGGGPTEVNL